MFGLVKMLVGTGLVVKPVILVTLEAETEAEGS
jgi:hypothetical protein